MENDGKQNKRPLYALVVLCIKSPRSFQGTRWCQFALRVLRHSAWCSPGCSSSHRVGFQVSSWQNLEKTNKNQQSCKSLIVLLNAQLLKTNSPVETEISAFLGRQKWLRSAVLLVLQLCNISTPNFALLQVKGCDELFRPVTSGPRR